MELLALVSHTSNGSVLEGPMNFIERSETSKPACTCCYIVVEIQGTWWIDVEGKPCGPCDTKQEAIEPEPSGSGLCARRRWPNRIDLARAPPLTGPMVHRKQRSESWPTTGAGALSARSFLRWSC